MRASGNDENSTAPPNPELAPSTRGLFFLGCWVSHVEPPCRPGGWSADGGSGCPNLVVLAVGRRLAAWIVALSSVCGNAQSL